jgi:hypothetical protein
VTQGAFFLHQQIEASEAVMLKNYSKSWPMKKQHPDADEIMHDGSFCMDLKISVVTRY